MTTYYSHKNRSLVAPTPELSSGPYVRNRNPDRGQTNVVANTNIDLTIAIALAHTVDLSTVVIRFSINGSAFIPVYNGSGGGFQAGYTNSQVHYQPTFVEDVYDFIILPDDPFPGSALIIVSVQAEDELGDPIDPPELYSFSIAIPPPSPPTPPTVNILPNNDTIRGGKVVYVFGTGPYDGQTNRLIGDAGQTLPTGWTGSGLVSPTVFGLNLSVPPTASSTSQVIVDGSFGGFDAAIDIEVRAPGAIMPATYEVAALTFTGDTSGVVSRLIVSLDPALSKVDLVASLSSTGGSLFGGAVTASTNILRTTLRLVKSGPTIWAYVGTRLSFLTTASNADLDTWTSLTSVGRLDVPDETGTLSFSMSNLTNPHAATTRFTNFTTRCHAKINGRLLDAKSVVGPRRLTGLVPAATLADVGATTIDVFGPGITGVLSGPFTYTLPLPLTIGTRVFDRLRFYGNPALYDPEG